MNSTIGLYVLESVIGLIFSIALFLIQRNFKKRSEETDKQLAHYIEGQQLQLQMLMANADLSYAIAMAVKRGTPNGEIEIAIEDYLSAKRAYDHFLTEQAAKTGIK